MRIPFFLIAIIFITSCNERARPNLQADSHAEPPKTKERKPKLTRTQGTNEFANVYCGIEDKAGNLWFGTSGEGVYCYDPAGINGKLFTQFTLEDGLSSNNVLSLLEDKDGSIWIGTDSGLCRYNSSVEPGMGTITRIPFSGTGSGSSLSRHLSDDVPSAKSEVWSMMQDHNGLLWLGTKDGVYFYDKTFFTSFLGQKNVNSSGLLHLKMVDDILEDKNGNVWFASGMRPGDEGVCRYDHASNMVTSFKPFGDGWIRTILEDKNGDLCFATRHKGAVRLKANCEAIRDPDSNADVNACLTNFTEKAGIDNGSVSVIYEDKAGNIWIGTELGSRQMGEDGGLWKFDPSASLRPGGKSFTRFTTKEGLIHNGVFCILEDRSGKIWIGTRNAGLCRYDPSASGSEAFTRFSE